MTPVVGHTELPKAARSREVGGRMPTPEAGRTDLDGGGDSDAEQGLRQLPNRLHSTEVRGMAAPL